MTMAQPSLETSGKAHVHPPASLPSMILSMASSAVKDQQTVVLSKEEVIKSTKKAKAPRSTAAAPDERVQRCRERNRIHARKTRLRKKEHMNSLQQKADELKHEQLRLKQVINEKNTASILVGFATAAGSGEAGNSSSKEDPQVEELLRRPAEEIPDSTKIPELPALILPGQHASKKAKAESDALKLKAPEELPNDGFDYELLGKDRSKCTQEELDQIRRERNRMHAKRTRDRKRLFMEEMGEICRQLEEENGVLRAHLKRIDPDFQDLASVVTETTAETITDVPLTPILPSTAATAPVKTTKEGNANKRKQPTKARKAKKVSKTTKALGTTAGPVAKKQKQSSPPSAPTSSNPLGFLLDAAKAFEKAPVSNQSTAEDSDASPALMAMANALAV